MEVDAVAGKEEEETLLPDASSPEVLEKYKEAGVIANRVLHEVLKNCVPGSKVVDLCQLGDVMIEAECAKVHTDLKSRGQKGIAFPTCIAVNEIAGHYSPLTAESKRLKLGDVVKVDLGAHIDGFSAVCAHTIVLGECKGKIADCIAAAWSGAQAALRLLKTGNKSTQITLATTKAGDSFGCEPMEAVLSHEMRQYVLDHENAILLKESEEHKCPEFEFSDWQVLGIDVMMSTGRGKAIDRGDKCSVFKRNVEVEHWTLKLKTAHDMIRAVNKNYPTFPFTLRAFERERFRFGVGECVRHALLQPYPVLCEREGQFVCQFKFTAIVTPDGVVQVCGLPLDMASISPTQQVTDADLKTLLDQPVTGKQPAFFEAVVMPDISRAVASASAKKARKSGAKRGGKSGGGKGKGARGKGKGKGGKKGRGGGKKPASKRPVKKAAAKSMEVDG